MTKTLDKTELVRLAWLTELRRQGHRKCSWDELKSWPLPKDEGVCALQLLAELCPRLPDGGKVHWSEAGLQAGLSLAQMREVYYRNDGCDHYHKHTFAEIADVVEGWFK